MSHCSTAMSSPIFGSHSSVQPRPPAMNDPLHALKCACASALSSPNQTRRNRSMPWAYSFDVLVSFQSHRCVIKKHEKMSVQQRKEVSLKIG